MVRPGPIERVRRRYRDRVGPRAAGLPNGYQRLGAVVLVRWPESLRADFPWLANELRSELGASTVLRMKGPVTSGRRLPDVEALTDGPTRTFVREDGLRFELDVARVLYSAGNRTERARMARLPRPLEVVYDLFAGIGYFALPIARHAKPRKVIAVEENPEAFEFLERNIALNHLGERVIAIPGDNRTVPLERGSADRVLLGFLPDARPWLPRAVSLLRPEGGWVHPHFLIGSSEPIEQSATGLRRTIEEAGAGAATIRPRRVKAYGPGREHWVADIRVVPKDGPAPG